MKVNGGLDMSDGGKAVNFALDSQTAFPPGRQGELFHLSAQNGDNGPGLYLHNGSAWEIQRVSIGALSTINLMPSSGRFNGTMQNPLDNSLYAVLGVSTFTVSTFLAAINGSAQTAGGRYYNNSSTYGGTATAVNAVVTSLMTKLGRTGDDARYGAEFFISQLVAGTAAQGTLPITTPDGTTRYLATTNGSKNMFISQKMCTFVCWVRVVSGSALFNTSIQYKNGVVSSISPIVAADGWVHIRCVGTASRGHNANWPNLYCTPGATIQLAFPGFFGGLVDVGLHTTPLPTINGQSA